MSLPIRDDLQRLMIDIDFNQTLWGEGGGRYRRGSWWTLPRGLDLVSLGKSFCDAIDQLETGYAVSRSPHWFSLGKKISDRLSDLSYATHQKVCVAIEQRLIALARRDNRTLEEAKLEENEKSVVDKLAREWKAQQKHMASTDWSEHDVKVIADVTAYPRFTRLISREKTLRDRFFTWALRDHMSVQSFVEFPKTQEWLEKHRLGPSIHLAGPEKLAVKTTKHGAKCLTFPLYGKHRGALRSKPVKLWNLDKLRKCHLGYKTTLRTIFDHIRRQNKKWVDFIVSENGFENWNVQHWGAHNSLGKIQKMEIAGDWYRRVPVLERLTLEEARKRFGKELDGTRYAVAIRASRHHLNLNVIGTHAFMNLCIPDRGGYIVISPGKFARVIPKNFWELVKIFGNSVIGVVVSHDPSVVYPWRQHIWDTEVVSEEEFQEFAEYVRETIEKGRSGNLCFSVFADSCASWARKMMEHLFKIMDIESRNFFRMKLKEADAIGLLGGIKKFIKMFPEAVQHTILQHVLLLFAIWRSLIIEEDGHYHCISAIRSDAYTIGEFENPAYLFHILGDRNKPQTTEESRSS